MNTAEKLNKLATKLGQWDMPNAAAIAREGATELRKCYVGRKTIAENLAIRSDDYIEMKVTYDRLKVEYVKLQDAVNALNDATYRLGLITSSQAE